MSNSPILNMPLPIPTITPGPTYAQNLVDSLTVIDSHDHSPGKGLLITPAAININTDIDFKSNSPRNVQTLQLNNLTADSPINRSVYFKNGELFIKDAVGNTVQVTNGGNIAGAVGTITGLVSPASASYSNVTKSFTFNFNSGSPGGVNVGDIRVYPFDASTNYTNFITLRSPTSLAGQYNITLPVNLPLTPGYRFTILDANGNLSTMPGAMPSTSGKRIVQMDELGNVTQSFQPLPSLVDNTTPGVVSTLRDGTLSVIKAASSNANTYVLMVDENGNKVGNSVPVNTVQFGSNGRYYYLSMNANRQIAFNTDAFGLVPYGAIIAIATNITGSFPAPPSGVITAGGWMKCDGAAIPAGYALAGYTPAINSGVFLRGNGSTAGAFGGTNSQINYHAHGMDHTHQMLVGGLIGDLYVNTSYGPGFSFNSGTAGVSQLLTNLPNYQFASGGAYATYNSTTANQPYYTARAIDLGGSPRSATDSGSASFDNQPNYIDVTYIIRCN